MSFEIVKQAVCRPVFKDIKFVDVAPTSVPVHQVQITPRKCDGFCLVPPHPKVRQALISDYRKEGKGLKPFFTWAKEKSRRPICPTTGQNSEKLANNQKASFNTGLARVAIPAHKIVGDVYLNVLLVKFPDQSPRPQFTKAHFEELLFSKNVLPNGSVADFYREVTQGKVNVKGFVSDWILMPKPKKYYTNRGYATDGAYPQNSEGLVEDAIKVAKAQGIVFPPELDFKRIGTVGAFYVFATGRGAEETNNPDDIWSHKGELRAPIKVGDDLSVNNYLFVPEDAQIGVCAHELGHLAFEWDDFYDPNYATDGLGWDGAGVWDLMAAGSWNGTKIPGDLPAPPAALHRTQHEWLQVKEISATTLGVTLPAQDTKQAQAIRLRSRAFKPTQSLILENRSTTAGTKYDKGLPGGGLLVWKVDTAQYQTSPTNPGMRLVEADKDNSLANDADGDDGDSGDPFPGATNNSTLNDSGPVNTSFSSRKKSGITLKNIKRDAKTDSITLDIVYA
eukprot:TRINITY_DN8837_c0_g1_i1.p1 TRINITY_DN8837_c0_g1~~TRINITY_DN8837_c0_g1_i1.p1  ORF type:complete len:506 (-),score=105.17 TRINITY_DN8837_c0_g1_i1:25-1542(-)